MTISPPGKTQTLFYCHTYLNLGTAHLRTYVLKFADPGPTKSFIFSSSVINKVVARKENIQELQEYTEAFQRGEEKGFDYFFRALYPQLLYFSFRITDDKSASEDIVEESFIKIWERYSSFSHPQVIKSWLYTTVRNASIDWLKDKQRARVFEQNFGSNQAPVVDIGVQYEVIYTEVITKLHAAIRQLPDRCQQVFLLLFIEGKTLKETADRMGVSINTIKNQRARGLKLLKKTLGPPGTAFSHFNFLVA